LNDRDWDGDKFCGDGDTAGVDGARMGAIPVGNGWGRE